MFVKAFPFGIQLEEQVSNFLNAHSHFFVYGGTDEIRSSTCNTLEIVTYSTLLTNLIAHYIYIYQVLYEYVDTVFKS